MSPRVAPSPILPYRRPADAGAAQAAASKTQKKRAPAPSLRLEALHPSPVCGVDEAGRGPWAGPVYAAAVILKKGRVPLGVNDSKKLSPATRERLEAEIKAAALAWAVASASVEEIAELNILHATGLAMRRAVEGLALRPAHALVDGNYRFPLPCPIRTVVQGDAISLSIGAASILAKTARDRVMRELDEVYPGYGFSAHKGYGARRHADALLELGPSPVHRLAWAPVRLAIAGRDPMLAGSALDDVS